MGMDVGGYFIGVVSVWVLRWIWKHHESFSNGNDWKEPGYFESPCFFK